MAASSSSVTRRGKGAKANTTESAVQLQLPQRLHRLPDRTGLPALLLQGRQQPGGTYRSLVQQVTQGFGLGEQINDVVGRRIRLAAMLSAVAAGLRNGHDSNTPFGRTRSGRESGSLSPWGCRR